MAIPPPPQGQPFGLLLYCLSTVGGLHSKVVEVSLPQNNMSKHDDDVLKKAIVHSIKSEMMKIEWWEEVQEDVRTRLEWIINRIDSIGTLFARSYMSLFRWEFERRKLEGQNITNPLAGYVSTLMGMRISEEAYQCGTLPTRSILDLYDYVQPNDSDVAACLFLCHKIEILERMGALQHDEAEMKTTPSEMSKAIRDLTRKKRKKRTPKIDEEKLTWDFDDEKV